MSSFASKDWADSFGTRLQESARVRTDSVTWVHGPIAMVVDGDAEHGFAETALRLELHEGTVRAVTVIEPADAVRCPFVIGGSLANWQAVLAGKLSIIDGILESKLRSRGDLPALTRHRGLLDAIAATGGELETTWQHEQEPAAAKA
jgi:putative sterol carrier protein